MNRRAKNLKAIIGQERERERVERDARRLAKEELMKMNPTAASEIPDEVPSCMFCTLNKAKFLSRIAIDTTIEAPPSVLPHRHLCDITGLEVRGNIDSSGNSTNLNYL